MKAFVDSREPMELKTITDIEFEDISIKELPQGDFYLPSEDVVIERKEASDFASSTTDGRLSEQADRMIDEHEHVYVIIENDIGSYYNGDDYRVKSLYNLRYSGVGSHSLIGMQTSLAVKRGIKIIYTESADDTVYAAKRVFERHLDGEAGEGDSHVKTADTGAVDDLNVKILMQIEGVSEQKARTIVKEVGDVGHIAWNVACERGDTDGVKDALRNIDGIGRVLAKRVINTFQ